MAKTRVGVLGLGMAAAPHARSLLDLKDRVEVAAAFSPTAARREAFANTYDLPTCDSADAIFGDASVDAVMILTPPNTHLELVRRAAETGKHVLLEKPLDISVERAEALVATMENTGKKLGVVLQQRFRPVSRTLEELVRSGRLGDLVGASAKTSNWRPQSYYDEPGRGTRARDGGGVLLTQAIHTLDLLISVAGEPIEVTGFAATTPVHSMETEDLATGAIRFAGGAIGTVSATTCAFPGFPDAIEIIGTRGVARLDGKALAVRFHDGGDLASTDDAAGDGTGANPMAFSHTHHRAVLADFLDAVETGSEPLVTGREALKVHRLIGALLRSAETGRREAV